MDEYMKDMFTFLKAQQIAEEDGQSEFTCPVCGGKAWWSRSSYNNHLHCRCEKCGLGMIQ